MLINVKVNHFKTVFYDNIIIMSVMYGPSAKHNANPGLT